PSSVLELQKVSGDGQAGGAGQPLNEPVKVRLVNSKGIPQKDVTVIFTVAEGGGSASPSTITTDHDGFALTTWTLGGQGNQKLHVTVEKPDGITSVTGSPLIFTAPFEVYTIQKVSGDHQKGFPRIELSQPLRIRVVDQNGVPKKNIPVQFIPTDSDAQVTNNSGATDNDGYAQANWILGNENNQILQIALSTPLGTTISGGPTQFSSTINRTIVAGGNGFGSAANQFSSTNDFYIDEQGNIYVSDSWNHRIQKWAPNATDGQTVAGTGTSGSASYELDYPNGVFVDGSGNIYVADRNNNRIQKFAPGSANGVTVAGGGGGITIYPRDIFVDATGNIYFSSSNSVYKHPASMGPAVSPNSQVAPLSGIIDGIRIFVDGSGNLYIAETYNHLVRKFAPGSATGIVVAGGNGQGNGPNQLSYPQGLSVDAYGNIYINEFDDITSTGRVTKWAPGANSGEVVAGGGGGDLFVDDAGAIYVAYFDAIYKWLP
ncbi:MAG: hypothetical protein EOP49_17390, partial [Sphingobacteriales bacterium]